MVYKLNEGNKHIYFYRFVYTILIIDFVLIVIFSSINGYDAMNTIKLIIGTLLFTILFYLGPLVYLFFNYTKSNKNQEFQFIDNSELVIKIGKLKKTISFSDIKRLEIHVSKTAFENRMKWFFWDELFYYKLVLKNEEKIIITCYVGNDIEKYFKPKKIKKIERIFPKIV